MSNKFVKINEYNDQSSDDSITTIKNTEHPNFYMIPSDKHPFEFLRKNLKTKYQILSIFHKNKKNKKILSKISWNTL